MRQNANGEFGDEDEQNGDQPTGHAISSSDEGDEEWTDKLILSCTLEKRQTAKTGCSWLAKKSKQILNPKKKKIINTVSNPDARDLHSIRLFVGNRNGLFGPSKFQSWFKKKKKIGEKKDQEKILNYTKSN